MIRVYEVRRWEAARMAQLLGVWEASVRATCLFLSEQKIRRLRSDVPQALASAYGRRGGHGERTGSSCRGRLPLRFIGGPIATRRAAPIRCCICGGKTTGAENSA